MNDNRWTKRTTEWHPRSGKRQRGKEAGRNRDGEMTWWRYEERHGQGMLKTDREMEDAERGLHSTEVDSA